MPNLKFKSPARAVAPLLTSAVLLTLAACKTPEMQSANAAPLASPAATQAAPMPAPPHIEVKLTPTYEAITKRDFGTQNDQLEAIIKQITAAAPDKYPEIELQLLGVLQSPTSTTPAKIFALDMLRVTGSEICIPTCASFLSDKDLSHNARRVLAGLNTPESTAALREALAHTDYELQLGIINTLGDLRDAAAIEPLKAIIKDALVPKVSDTATAVASYNALGKIGTLEAEKAFTNSPVPPALKDAWGAAYLRCANTLAAEVNLGPWQSPGNLVPNMYGALLAGEYSSAIKAGAFTGSVNLLKEKSIPLIIENLKSPDELLRRAAGSAAISVPGNAATLAIAKQLSAATTKEDKRALLAILSARNDAKGITPQINELASEKNTDQDIRLAAIAALSTLGDTSSVPILATALKTQGPLNTAAWQTLADLDDPAVTEALLKQVHSEDTAIRAAIINALAEKHIAALLPIARTAADDTDASIRATAFKAIGTLGDATDFKNLLARLQTNKNEADRTAIIEGLTTLARRNEKEKNPLIDAIVESIPKSDPDAKARLYAVLSVLGGDKALAAIRPSLTDPDENVRKSAVRVLSNWQGTATMNDLLKVAKDDADGGNKILALQGYIRMASSNGNNNEKVNRLKSAAEVAARPDEKRRVLSALGNISTPESLKAVEPMLTDKELENEAYAAYEKIAETLARNNGTAAVAKTALIKVSTDAPNAQLKDRAKRAAEAIK